MHHCCSGLIFRRCPDLLMCVKLLRFRHVCFEVAMIEAYLRANKLFVDYIEPQQDRAYSSYLELNLDEVEPCISGPKRPHDRVPLKEMKSDWHASLGNKVGFKNSSVDVNSFFTNWNAASIFNHIT